MKLFVVGLPCQKFVVYIFAEVIRIYYAYIYIHKNLQSELNLYNKFLPCKYFPLYGVTASPTNTAVQTSPHSLFHSRGKSGKGVVYSTSDVCHCVCHSQPDAKTDATTRRSQDTPCNLELCTFLHSCDKS